MPADTTIRAEAEQNRADQQRAWKAADLEYPGKSELYDSTRALFALGFRAGLDDERRESRALIARLTAERDNARGLLEAARRLGFAQEAKA